MPRKLPEKVRKAPRKLRKQRSASRYCTIGQIWQKPRIRRDQELEVAIDDIGSRGDGTAIVQGYRIFVPGTKTGERVRIRIVSVGGKFAVGKRIFQDEGFAKEISKFY